MDLKIIWSSGSVLQSTVFSPQAENLKNISTCEYHQYFDFIGKAKLIVIGTSNFYTRFEKQVSEPLTQQSLDLNLKLLWILQISKSYDDLNNRRRNVILRDGAIFLKITRKSKRSFGKFTRELQILPQNLGGGGTKPYCCPLVPPVPPPMT